MAESVGGHRRTYTEPGLEGERYTPGDLDESTPSYLRRAGETAKATPGQGVVRIVATEAALEKRLPDGKRMSGGLVSHREIKLRLTA